MTAPKSPTEKDGNEKPRHDVSDDKSPPDQSRNSRFRLTAEDKANG